MRKDMSPWPAPKFLHSGPGQHLDQYRMVPHKTLLVEVPKEWIAMVPPWAHSQGEIDLGFLHPLSPRQGRGNFCTKDFCPDGWNFFRRQEAHRGGRVQSPNPNRGELPVANHVTL